MKIMQWIYPELETGTSKRLMAFCFGLLILAVGGLVVGIAALITGFLSAANASLLLRGDLLILYVVTGLAITLSVLQDTVATD